MRTLTSIATEALLIALLVAIVVVDHARPKKMHACNNADDAIECLLRTE